LHALGRDVLDETSARRTLGAVLKFREDAERARADIRALVEVAVGRG
jgi:hypothetical protein